MVLQSKTAAPSTDDCDGTIIQYGIHLGGLDTLPNIEKHRAVGERLLQAIVLFEPRLSHVRLLSSLPHSNGMNYLFSAELGEETLHFSIAWNDALDNALVLR